MKETVELDCSMGVLVLRLQHYFSAAARRQAAADNAIVKVGQPKRVSERMLGDSVAGLALQASS